MAKRAAAKSAAVAELARGFSLLADPTRVGILAELSKGPKNVTALCKAVGQKQPTISHHLGLLRMGCFVSGSRSGKSVVYVSCKPCLKELAAGLARLMP